jgi:hypothetical protein
MEMGKVCRVETAQVAGRDPGAGPGAVEGVQNMGELLRRGVSGLAFGLLIWDRSPSNGE